MNVYMFIHIFFSMKTHKKKLQYIIYLVHLGDPTTTASLPAVFGIPPGGTLKEQELQRRILQLGFFWTWSNRSKGTQQTS